MIRLTSLLNEFWPFKKKPSSAAQPTAKKKAGDVWKTDGGRFGSINKSYPNYPRYFDTEEKARRYATANIKKPAKQPEQPVKPADQNSLAQKTLSAEKERKKAMLAKFKDKPQKKTDDDETLQILRQLQQMQKDEPSKDKNDDDSKFGGGGGFSGGGGGSSF